MSIAVKNLSFINFDFHVTLLKTLNTDNQCFRFKKWTKRSYVGRNAENKLNFFNNILLYLF